MCYLCMISPVPSIVWVHSSVVRAADCRSAGPWLKSGCALGKECRPFAESSGCSRTEKGDNSVWSAPASRTSLAIRNRRHCLASALGFAHDTECKHCRYLFQDTRWTSHVEPYRRDAATRLQTHSSRIIRRMISAVPAKKEIPPALCTVAPLA